MARILIADDDADLRDVLRQFLELDKHTVVEAADGQETLAAVRASSIDLLILDVVMPKKGGIETLLDMCGTETKLKIILMTGKIDTTTDVFQELCRSFKAMDILVKPFTKDVLTSSVNRALASDTGGCAEEN